MHYAILNFVQMNFVSVSISVLDGDTAILYYYLFDAKIILIQFSDEVLSYCNHSISNI